jgi:hypothetical protein
VGTSTPLSRRLVLRGAALTGLGVALAGCASAARPEAGPGSSGSADPDVLLVKAAIADEQAVLEVCGAAVAGRPSLRPAVAPVVASQHAHIAALRAALTAGTRVPARPHRPPHAARQAGLSRVRSSLLDAQRHRRADALVAGSGPLARLLASISAAHAVDAALRP